MDFLKITFFGTVSALHIGGVPLVLKGGRLPVTSSECPDAVSCIVDCGSVDFEGSVRPKAASSLATSSSSLGLDGLGFLAKELKEKGMSTRTKPNSNYDYKQ